MRVPQLLLCLFYFSSLYAQKQGVVKGPDGPLEGATLWQTQQDIGVLSDAQGRFSLDSATDLEEEIVVSYVGFKPFRFRLKDFSDRPLIIQLDPDTSLNEIVVSSGLLPVKRLESTIPVEVYGATFFKQNPTPSLFEGLQNINGVRPQINCSVCNTGDIHINGLEGPYTFVLIDGMPIVSSLSSVYGLNGISTGLIERVEVVKGPAGTLYGSQAVGGLINVITKVPEQSPKLYIDTFSTSWSEHHLDLGLSQKYGDDTYQLLGVNTFFYDNPIDNNSDGFTDVTLQKRVSIFNKIQWKKKNQLAVRFLYEDRWGGEMDWTSEDRGSNQVYGESIFTRRYEFIGQHSDLFSSGFQLQYSYTDHNQNSYYGDTPYMGHDRVGFIQLFKQQQIQKHKLLFGTALRYSYYNDNTPATEEANTSWLPGVFVEDEYSIDSGHDLLMGLRWDHHPAHASIWTPRVGYRWNVDEQTRVRLNFGTGFRVVNLFTEDHAALSGARDVILEEDLEPEQSRSINLNFSRKFYTTQGWIINWELQGWYTHFDNQILPDYDTDPNQIRYANLNGFSFSQGISTNVDFRFWNFTGNVGASLLDVRAKQDGELFRPVLTENWSGVWGLNYQNSRGDITIDYTGNLYGSMRLPLAGENDPRSEFSPVWSLQNLTVSWRLSHQWNIYFGCKNLLDWTPADEVPFLIARSNDPFDRQQNDPVDNPYGLSFDPTYIYAPNQGRRIFVGLRMALQ